MSICTGEVQREFRPRSDPEVVTVDERKKLRSTT